MINPEEILRNFKPQGWYWVGEAVTVIRPDGTVEIHGIGGMFDEE